MYSPDPYRTVFEREGFKVRFAAVLRIDLSPLPSHRDHGGPAEDPAPPQLLGADPESLDALVGSPGAFAGLVFTSQNGVRAFAAAADRRAALYSGDGSNRDGREQYLSMPDPLAGWRESAVYALGSATARACAEVLLNDPIPPCQATVPESCILVNLHLAHPLEIVRG